MCEENTEKPVRFMRLPLRDVAGIWRSTSLLHGVYFPTTGVVVTMWENKQDGTVAITVEKERGEAALEGLRDRYKIEWVD